MEPHERVRYLRKQYLKMTQTEFGEHLGVSRSVINNIELNYLSRPEKKISLLKLICREFGVSEEWLLYGKGEMLVDNNNEYDLLVDRIIPETNQFARNIFKTFARFELSDWQALEHMISIYKQINVRDINSSSEFPASEKELAEKYVIKAVDEDNA